LINKIKIKQLATDLLDVEVMQTLIECRRDTVLLVPGFQVVEAVQTEYSSLTISNEHD